ncbi:hypothetical protein DBR47_12425 [Paucibacter sp. KBW04]|uniref:M48 family metalloprotease n=1 Tax=Paucibacter sp. KBW04 TaxID=2153361 RepID=UPI000F5867DE|nr:M48 family metalloprotease [Paucibacter sp. KBW04]RQO58509.1 hypothetical protein DBR47_12425 [Paucibacter sp. KBW04]
MSIIYVSPASLNPLEQAQLLDWTKEIRELALRSRSKSLAKAAPRLVIIELNAGISKSLTHQASTNGRDFTISRDMLPINANLRRYFIAHELGHVEGHHSLVSSAGVILALLSIALMSAYVKLFSGNPKSVLSFAGPLIVVGIATAIAYDKSMLFEWDADRRAARMLGPTGTAEMLAGIALIKALRSPSMNAFYDNKRDRLQNKKPSIWQPRG